MIRNGRIKRIAFLQQKAQQEKAIVLLKAQWTRYSPHVQAALETHLMLYGYDAARNATELVEQLLGSSSGEAGT